MTSRYLATFAQLKENNEGAFVPFITMGDPDKETSFEIIKTLIDAGADALELGIPFSDPIADGPTIQAAAIRALDKGMTPTDCFEVIKKVREYNADIPIGLLLYSNLVVANGIDNFYQQCADAGVDSILVADVPIRESIMFRQAAEKYSIDPIFIATPNATDEVLGKLAEYCSGYTYLLSRAGVTGAETAAEMPAEDLVKRLNQFNAPPALLGFGISQPKQVQEAIQAGADGAISGSAVVNIIAENLDNKDAMLSQLASFVTEMKAATKK